MNWITNGKQPCGMVVRLQGFGPGLFGGNYHTHNMLHMPPGVDVVCYSNGPDYVRGMRYAVEQAKQGRVVMSVDCTHLLNMRHLYQPGDEEWMFPYPAHDEIMSFDEVRVHSFLRTYHQDLNHTACNRNSLQVRTYGDGSDVGIVTYGTGVLDALQVQQTLQEEFGLDVTVVDSPYLSGVSTGLTDVLKNFNRVLFADICKEGQNPFSSIVTLLNREEHLPKYWDFISAPKTYNPLGNMVSFLGAEDIKHALLELLDRK